ncbi:MAG: hypothetical protein AB7U38_04835 [Hyphomicrobiales bacterium]
MLTIVTVLAELIFMVCVAAGIPFVLLAFRNEHRPALLRRGGMEAIAANLIAIGIVFAIGFLINGFTNAGMNALYAIMLSAVLFFGAAIVIWKVFGVTERLRRADGGESPFYLPEWSGRGGSSRNGAAA